jgi:hypothetical protein
MSFSLDLQEGGEERPRPPFFDLQEQIMYLLEEMHENGASLEEKKAVFLATLAANHWTAEDYGKNLLIWLGVHEIEFIED